MQPKLICGVRVALLLWGLVLVGRPARAQFGMAPPAAQQPPPACLNSPPGRYVFGELSGAGHDVYMLDTETGRLWRLSSSGKVGPFLQTVPYCTPEGDCGALPFDTRAAPAPAPAR